MAAVRIFLLVVCFAFNGWGGLFDRHLLDTDQPMRAADVVLKKKLIELARAELGVREATGNNDGKRVEEYLTCVGLKKGQPYCAAFVSFIFKQAGYAGRDAPRTGWSPALFPNDRLIKARVPGNVFGIYFPALKRIGHCGFIERLKGDWLGTIEANTNVAGSRDGDGVYRRMRHRRTVHCMADWTLTSL
jgi:hypothetical protein